MASFIVLSLRNVEADVAIRSTAAVFTYCRSRGLFAGISLEGSGLIERKETNRKYVQNLCLNAHLHSPSLCSKRCLCEHGSIWLQVLLPRHPCVGHFERRRGAAARMLRPLPHPGRVHRGLHDWLDQQEHALKGKSHHLHTNIYSLNQTLATRGVRAGGPLIKCWR